MTLTETITQELPNAVGHPEELENIRRTYGRSKGPYYAGLGDATSQLQDQLEELLEEISDAIGQRKVLEQQVATLRERRQGLEDRVQAVVGQVQEAEGRLAAARELLDHALDLERRGFGEEELARLYQLLAEIAASQGAPPEVGIARFFQTVERYERVVSLDLEARRGESRVDTAKAEAERWETKVEAREVQSKARISIIDLVENLLDKRVKADDFIGWAAIIEKAGVTAGELGESLAEYSTIQALSTSNRSGPRS